MEDLTDMQNHVLPYLQSFCSLEEKGVKERREQQVAEKNFGSRRTVRVYVSAVLFLFFGVKTVMFFLCTVECYSIIKPVFCISIKAIIWKSANQMKVWDAKLQGL